MLDRLLRYGALVGLLGVLAILWVPVLQGLQAPMMEGEEMHLSWMGRVIQGRGLYLPSAQFEEGVTPAYSPLYYYGAGGASKLLKVDPLLAGRWYSISGAYIGLISIYLACLFLTKTRWVGFLAVLLVSLHPIFRSDSVVLRPDLFAWGVSMFALVQVVQRRYWVALPFMVAAVFTKQNYVALPIAVAAFLFLQNKALAFKWSAGFVLCCGAVLGMFSAMTGGEAFRHMILYPLQSGGVSFTWQFSLVALMFVVVPVAFSVVYMVQYREVKTLIPVYFLVSLVVMVALIGKDGAGINYSFEVLAAGSLLTSLYFWRMISERSRKFGDMDSRVDVSTTSA